MNRPINTPLSRFVNFRLGVVLCVSLGAVCCKEKSERKDAPAPAPVVAPRPGGEQEAEPPTAAPDQTRQLAQLRREANALFAESSFDEARAKVDAGLALDPEFTPLLRLKRRIDDILSHRCCGKWLRYDTSKPDSKDKDVRGVLYSDNLGKNMRDHAFRARLLVACDQGKPSTTVLVPWDVPEKSPVSIEYVLGEDKGNVTANSDVKELGYLPLNPEEWLKKLGEHEAKTLALRLPKRDGSTGEFVFSLGEAKKLIDEIVGACQ